MEPKPELTALQRRYVPPPGLDRARPRDVQLTAGGLAVFIGAIVLFVAAVAAGVSLQIVARLQADERWVFDARGVDTTGEVVRLWRTSNESKTPRVAYTFTVSDRAYAGEATISLSRWRRLTVGAPMDIRYQADQPARNAPAGTEPRVMPAFMPVIAFGALAIAGLGLLSTVHVQRRMLMDGRAAPAIVTEHSHGGKHRFIKYEFPLLSGAAAAGKCNTSSKPPAVGSVICVLYDPEHPRRSMQYPLALVRPEVMRNA